MPGDACRFRNELADVAAVRIEGLVLVDQHSLQFKSVGLPKSLLQQSAGDFEPDAIVVAVRSIPLARNFKNVESKFGLHVRETIVFKRHAIAEFLPQARIQDRNGSIDAQTMAVVVRSVVRQGADSKSKFVDVLRIAQECLNEVAAANVMREVAKEGLSVRIVAHVLNDRASIGIGLRTAQIFLGSLWKFLEKQGLYVRLPGGIDDSFVGKDCVRANGRGRRQPNAEQANSNQTRAIGHANHDSSARRICRFSSSSENKPRWTIMA